jgi:large subunit ribosomal protein L32e
MTDKKKLLELRSKMKKKRPLFARKDNNKKKRIEDDVWRKARGCDNKQRLKRKGHKKTPRMGFRGPALVRGLDKSGLEPVLVSNVSQLKKLNKEQGIIITSNTGDRKRSQILEEAKKMNVVVLNLDATKAIEQINTSLKLRKEARSQKMLEAKKTESSPKKDKDKESKSNDKKSETKNDSKQESTESDDEKKKQEQEEKNKVLTMKQ